jgi:hypothetical protein
MTTTYTMTVTFEKNDPNETILAGMWGSAKIILNKIEDVLLVPSQAITTISWQNMVMLKKWDQRIETPVEIWDSDETNTEIVSWLKAWDIVKSMFYSTEAMLNMWLSSESSSIELWDRDAARDNIRENMNSFGWGMGWWNRNGWGFPWWWMWW